MKNITELREEKSEETLREEEREKREWMWIINCHGGFEQNEEEQKS